MDLRSFEALAGPSGFSRPDELRVSSDTGGDGGREGRLERGATGDLVFLWLQLCGWWALQRGGMTHLKRAPRPTTQHPQEMALYGSNYTDSIR